MVKKVTMTSRLLCAQKGKSLLMWTQITSIFHESRGIYGPVSIWRQRGKPDRLHSQTAKIQLLLGGGITPETDNIISCNFHTDRLYEKLLTDITEFMLPDGKVYLPAMIDCFDRRALGWTIGNHPNADVANRMLGAGNF